MLLNLIFPDDFNSAFNLSCSVLGNSNLAKAAFSKNTANLVLFLNIRGSLEFFEVFEIKDVKETTF